ncbi:hypothetical protein M3223_17730 [Paenibacillus pasadenensis]|uniref:hypothetical protein n=1 Tax=Paenibacillus pasadenensis TaxID=217090 RepID=UPI00203ECACC|nr:hypothetical protein [Paenibacillus pasadenensis]MCM3749201.1 hypothetical protein [Paenibacillus pasadenensis]
MKLRDRLEPPAAAADTKQGKPSPVCVPRPDPLEPAVKTEFPITGMQLYVLDRYHGSAAGGRCRFAVLQLSCGACSGWSEELVSAGNEPFDLVRFAGPMLPLRRMTVEQAWSSAMKCRSRWGEARSHLVVSALLELEKKLDSGCMAEWTEGEQASADEAVRGAVYCPLMRTPEEPDEEALFRQATAYFDFL